jgi:hypothetical protein
MAKKSAVHAPEPEPEFDPELEPESEHEPIPESEVANVTVPDPPPVPMTGKKVRPKPFSAERHKGFAGTLCIMAQSIGEMQKTITEHYPSSTEPVRAVREFIRSFNKLRAGLNSKYFSEGQSSDGLTPYYPPGGPILNVSSGEAAAADSAADDPFGG